MSDGLSRELALAAAICGLGVACGGGGGGGSGNGNGNGVAGAPDIFSAQLFPIQLAGTTRGFGGAAFASDGELLVAGGGGRTLFGVSRSDGSVREVATEVGSDPLLSVVDPDTGLLYAGDNAGFIHSIDAAGNSTQLADTAAGPVNGMVIAPDGYGDFGGDIIAATGTGGIVAVDPSAPGTPTTLADPGPVYSDLVFVGTALYALDHDTGEIDTVLAAGGIGEDGFATGLTSPDGIAADAVNDQLLVADSGTETLHSVPLPGGGPSTAIGAFDFDTGTEPSGLAFDGVGNLVLLTEGLTLRGVGIPGYDPSDFPTAIANTGNGTGSLAFDRSGDLVGVANDAAADTNRVFRVARSDASVSNLTTNLGNPAAGELLLGVAVDPATSTTYVGTSEGSIYAVNAGGTSLFATTSVSGESVNGLAFAPASFDSARAGHLVAVTDHGRVLAFDIANPVEDEIRSDAGELFGALVFAADGTLYATEASNLGNAEIVEVDDAGASTLLTDGLSFPGGLGIDEARSRLLVADAGTGELLPVSFAGATAPPLDSGFDFSFPSGVVFDGLGSVLLLTGTGIGGASVEEHTILP